MRNGAYFSKDDTLVYDALEGFLGGHNTNIIENLKQRNVIRFINKEIETEILTTNSLSKDSYR